MVELACESDFVARTDEFKSLAHDLAMQVAAMGPVYVDESDVEEGDSRPVAQVSLLQQPFIKDNSSSVGEVLRKWRPSWAKTCGCSDSAVWPWGSSWHQALCVRVVTGAFC